MRKSLAAHAAVVCASSNVGIMRTDSGRELKSNQRTLEMREAQAELTILRDGSSHLRAEISRLRKECARARDAQGALEKRISELESELVIGHVGAVSAQEVMHLAGIYLRPDRSVGAAREYCYRRSRFQRECHAQGES